MKFNFLLSFIILLAACKPSQQTSLIKAKDFYEKSASGDIVILDVRTPEEYNEGFIKGAINIDINSSDFDTKIAQLDKSKSYYVYCKSGNRSDDAYSKMTAAGFKSVFKLDGGIKAWQQEKMPLEIPVANPTDTTTKVAIENPKDFKTAIYGNKLVFVDFNAPWCGPCRKMQPFVDIIKEERASEVIVFSINTDEEVDLAKEYQIYNLPTVVLIKNGAVLYRQEGYQDEASLNALVTKFK